MAVDPVVLSVGLTAISTSLGAFYQMMPSPGEVRSKSCNDHKFAANVRVSEAMATIIAVGVGGILSGMTNSATPVILSGIFAMGMVALYEYTLRADALMEA